MSVSDEFLNKQIPFVKELADLITNAKRCADGLGTFVFDHELESS